MGEVMAEVKIKVTIIFPWYLQIILNSMAFAGVMVCDLIIAYEGFLLVCFNKKTSEYSEHWINVKLHNALYWTAMKLVKKPSISIGEA